jgi:hypothetical protein
MTAPARTITMVPFMATPLRAEGLAGQVWHLLRVDLLRVRWWLIAHVAVLSLGVLRALEVLPLNDMQSVLVGLAVPLLVMLSAVVLVQGDHPTAPNAFWRGKPTSPWAQIIAKLLLLVAMVTVTLMVLAATLGVSGVPLARTLTLVRACLPGMLMFPVLALTVGAVTRDLRSAPLLFVGIAALTIGTRMIDGLASMGSPMLWLIEAWLAVAGGVVLLAALYHGAVRTRPALVGTVVLGVLALDSMTRELTEQRAFNPPADVVPTAAAGETPRERLVIDSMQLERGDAGSIMLRYHIAEASPDARYLVQGARLTAYFADGTSAPLAMMDGGTIEARLAASPLPAGSRWAVSQADPVPASGTMEALAIIVGDKRQRASSIRSIEMQGRLRRLVLRDTLSVPWEAGDVLRAQGERLQLLDTTASGGEWLLRWTEPQTSNQVEHQALGESTSNTARTTYARIDRSGVAHPIGAMHMFQSSSSVPFVLPWVVRRVETIRPSLDVDAEVSGRSVDVAGSRLHVVRWKTAAVVPVRAEYRMPEKGPESR